jgi:hypothetical protein
MTPGSANQLPDFIAETPFHAIMLGLLAIFVFGTVWLLSKRTAFLVLAVVSLLAMIGAIMLERWVVTDREQISVEVDAMAAAVAANSPTSLLLHISDRYPSIKDAARGHFNRWQIEFCNLTSREVPAIDWSRSPPQAEVRFVVFARARQKQGDGLGGADIVGVTLQMEKEPDGRWRVISYSLFNPRGGPAPAY